MTRKRSGITSRNPWIAAVFLPLLASCGIGKDSILFMTKTSLGIDVDSKPPTLDISYTRKEGTLSPVFDDEVLPQMASFATNSGLVNAAVGQSFATGNAAVLLAKYFDTAAEVKVKAEIEENEITGNTHSRVEDR